MICALLFWVPLFAAAYTTNTESVSETGGASADSHEVIVTGSSDASADIRTIMRGGATGTDVVITTERDGVRTTEIQHQNVPLRDFVQITATSSRTLESRISTSSGARDVRDIRPLRPFRATSSFATTSRFSDIFRFSDASSTAPFGAFESLFRHLFNIFKFF